MGRGLEPAGVNLEARGFKRYIQNLTEIERKQREVFERDFKGTGRSFSQVQKAARDYEKQLKSLESQYNRAVAQEQKLNTAQSKTVGGVNSLNSALGQLAIAAFSRRTVEAVAESAKAAAAFNGQSRALNNLAGSYGQSSSEIRAAMRRAAQGVLSESAIIESANKALLLGVAETPEQFEEVTRAAIVLGRTVGLDASQAIERFTTGLGRQSKLIIDDFGLSVNQLNAEIDRLALAQFGVPNEQLSEAQKQAVFLEAALGLAAEKVETINVESLKATENFDRLTAETENLELAFGEAVLPLVGGLSGLLAKAAQTAQELLAFIAAGVGGVGSIIAQIGGILGDEGLAGLGTIGENLDQILDEAALVAVERFKDVARASGVAFPEDVADDSTQSVKDNTEALEDNEDQIKALQNAIRQAEQLELSFARAAEDAARKQARQVAKLNRDQFKERQKFLNDQAKEFDDFNADQAEAVADAEEKLADARAQASKERIREQDKLFRELRQAQERFDLDRIQSQRRFNLDETRLRAEGDILGLQRLREDFDLEQQEQAENFDLQQRQRKEDAKEQEKDRDDQRQERVQALEKELNDLQNSFEERRAEFLKAQDEEFQALLEGQAEQRLALQQSFAEQEEDRRISQQRQIEDLGRSLAVQEDITAEGAAAIAQQLEEAFGVDGVADQIMTGFTMRQESAFQSLFESIADDFKEAEKTIADSTFGPGAAGGFGANPSLLLGQLPGFQHGGSFTVGGTGGADSQLVAFRGTPGEQVTVTPQQQQFRMPIAAPSQLNVSFGGRSQIDVTGLEGTSQATIDAAVEQMIQIQDIAIRRILRRSGVN